MINNDMRWYEVCEYDEQDAYGQLSLDTELVINDVHMAIYLTSQSIQDNINYKNASYLGLTYNNDIKDTYVIKYGDKLLKVLYVNPQGRLNQVFMSEI